MDKKNLMPHQAQPIERITTGQLPDELAELSEEALQLHGDSAPAAVLASYIHYGGCSGCGDIGMPQCSYDGDDAE